jgi:hypothetical protein
MPTYASTGTPAMLALSWSNLASLAWLVVSALRPALDRRREVA